MRNSKIETLKYTFMSFSLAFFIFSLVLMLMMRYTSPVNAVPAEAKATVTEEAYKPSHEDKISILFMGTATVDSTPGLYILAKFEPVTGTVNLLILPPETAAQNNGRIETLTEIYKYGGAAYTRDTLAKTLGVDIDRFVRMDFAAFVQAADAIGSVETALEDDIEIENGGARVHMRAGTQLLDGQKLLALIRAYNAENGMEKYELIGKICVDIVNQRRDIALSTAYESVFGKIINIIGTDISYADFHSRLEAAAYLAQQDAPANLLIPTGTWENNIFTLSDTSISARLSRKSMPSVTLESMPSVTLESMRSAMP